MKVLSLALFCTLDLPRPSFFPSWIVFTSVNLLLLCILLSIISVRMIAFQRQTKRETALSKLETDSLHRNAGNISESFGKLGFWGGIIFVSNICASIFIAITGTVYLANTATYYLSSEYGPNEALLIGFESTDCALSVLFMGLVIVREWLPFAMVAQALTVVVSVLNFLISILTIWSNESFRLSHSHGDVPHSFSPVSRDDREHLLGRVRIYQFFACVVAFSSGVGVVTGLAVDATNRLSDIGSTVSLVYIMTCFVAFVINTVYLGLSCENVTYFSSKNTYMSDVLIADPILASVGMALSLCGIAAMMKVRQRPSTDLVVEEYDLNRLNSGQLEVWARLIDIYNNMESSNPDAAAGHEAISLLNAYSGSPMANMNCRVLRVYDVGKKAYEKIRAWEKLDEHEAFDHDETPLLLNRKASVVNRNADDIKQELSGGGMSKNAAKRAERKAAKKAAKKGGNNAASTVHEQLQISPEEIQRDINFRNDLIATEALILLTSVEGYDLLGSVKDKWYGKVASKVFGPLKLFSVRMGLLASHWPFRQAILYTSPTKKPNARAAAVCRAIADYNKHLPRSKRCTMILNPTVAHRGIEKAIKPSGWSSVPLPPSHIIDLRPYKNNTLAEYLKKIKYRDQAKNFQKAHGEVIQTSDFNSEDCEIAINLWWNIASKRTADGNTSVLVNPTADFLRSLGTISNEKGYRSLLFLKVDGQIIASAVLFRLGNTITSDIQGLDHECARKYNAYFVMMQETISIALKEGLKFVDFGPTTSQPKMAIGCKEVEIFGGIYARAPLSWLIPLFSGSVQVDE